MHAQISFFWPSCTAPIYTFMAQFSEVAQVFILFQFLPYGRVKASQAIWQSSKGQPE